MSDYEPPVRPDPRRVTFNAAFGIGYAVARGRSVIGLASINNSTTPRTIDGAVFVVNDLPKLEKALAVFAERSK